MNNKKIVPYFIVGDDDFKKKVHAILHRSKWQDKYQIYETTNKDAALITINLTKRSDMERWHSSNNKQFYPSGKQIRFSVTTQSPIKKPEIFIDRENWLYGVDESGLTKEQYQEYVINHEFGHGLGYDHQKCLGQSKPETIYSTNQIILEQTTCPVMYQMTRGVPVGAKPNYQVTAEDYNKRISDRYLGLA